MSENLSAFLYLVASICFIMALRGLSSPETARGGNIYGIAGMVIAIVTTLATPHVVSFWLIILGILIGGAVGTYIALQHPDDGLAAAGGGVSQPGRPRRGLRRRRRLRRARNPTASACAARSTAAASSRWRSGWRSARSPSPARSSPLPNCRGWSPAAPLVFPGQHLVNAGARRSADPADRAVRARPRRRRLLRCWCCCRWRSAFC